MRYAIPFAHSLLLLAVPAIAAYPQTDIPDSPILTHHVSSIEMDNEVFSYDDILDLLEEIEDGDIEERCSPEEIDGINRFVALLAQKGILPGDIGHAFEINSDIEDLLSETGNSPTR